MNVLGEFLANAAECQRMSDSTLIVIEKALWHGQWVITGLIEVSGDAWGALRPLEVPCLTIGETELPDRIGLEPMVSQLRFAPACYLRPNDL